MYVLTLTGLSQDKVGTTNLATLELWITNSFFGSNYAIIVKSRERQKAEKLPPGTERKLMLFCYALNDRNVQLFLSYVHISTSLLVSICHAEWSDSLAKIESWITQQQLTEIRN